MISRVSTASILQGFVKSRSFLAGNSAYSPYAFESIATATGTGSSGTITFSSIPSTYTHLQIRYIARSSNSTGSGMDLITRCNNLSTSIYVYHELLGNGTTASATGFASLSYMRTGVAAENTDAANIFGVGIIDLLDYTSTTNNKTFRTLTGIDKNGSGNILIRSGLIQTTSAINRIDIDTSTGFWTTTSTFALYGIKAA